MAENETNKNMTACKSCGKDMAKTAKACPSCGAVNKPPFYKNGCFIAFAIVALLFICGGICMLTGLLGGAGDTGTSSGTGRTSDETTAETEEEAAEPAVPELTEEEYKAECNANVFTYEELSRTPDDYIGKKTHFRGQVIQEQTEGSSAVFRVNVTPTTYEYIETVTWDDTIYVEYDYYDQNNRILEEDIVNIYGEMAGVEQYEAIFGNEITIPKIEARYIDVETE